MDLNETTEKVLNRHPWELSRTYCTLKAFSKYLDEQKEDSVYINAGAGDLYFDRALLRKYEKNSVHAIDIAYKKLTSKDKRISKYHYLEEIPEMNVDYAVMMDSLEYMEDDADYVRKMSSRIKKGGYFFFTLPAFPVLFSDYDINIKNLRRYDRKTISQLLRNVPELEKIEEYYFYTSLFMVRFMQKILHLPIDSGHKFTAHWKYTQKNPVTVFLTVCLNLDFVINRFLSRLGIRFPGLSMLIVCRKH